MNLSPPQGQAARQLQAQHNEAAAHHRQKASEAVLRGDHSAAMRHQELALEAVNRSNGIAKQLKALKPSAGRAIGGPVLHRSAFEPGPGSALKAALDSTEHGSEPLVVDSAGPAVEQSYLFPYQSFCSPALLQYALLPQTPNVQIVSPVEGADGVQIGGYAVAALPSNETPLAIRFRGGGMQGNSSVMLLLPGQVITPHGLVDHGEKVGARGGRSGSFSAFDLGLPFGWLGGGVGTVVILKNPNATVDWHAPGDVMYHQATYAIVAPPAGAFPAPPFNYPGRLPWPAGQVKAPVSAAIIAQGGQPKMQMATSRVAMRLRVSGLAAPAAMEMVWQAINPMDVGADGLTPAANNTYVPITWPQDAAGLGVNGAWPYQALDEDFLRIFADAGGVNLIDLSGGTLTGQFMDIQRWGRL